MNRYLTKEISDPFDSRPSIAHPPDWILKEIERLKDDIATVPPQKLQTYANIKYTSKKKDTNVSVAMYRYRIRLNVSLIRRYDKSFHIDDIEKLLENIVGPDEYQREQETRRRIESFQEPPSKKLKEEIAPPNKLKEEIKIDPKFPQLVDQPLPDETTWKRPPLPEHLGNITFMKVDIDYTFGRRHRTLCSLTINSDWIPILRLFGCTQDGNSVCAHVHGFQPYLYCEAPPHLDLGELKRLLEEKLALKSGYFQKYDTNFRKMLLVKGKFQKREDFVQHLEIIQAKSIYGYSDIDKDFVKITLIRPQHVPIVRKLLEDGTFLVGGRFIPQTTYECNIEFVIRYMADNKIGGFTWMEIPKEKYILRDRKNAVSTCQIEIDLHYDSIIAHSTDDIAPIRTLSFDIECKGRKGFFPDGKNLEDKVIQIANVVSVYGRKDPIITNVFCFGSSSSIKSGKICEFSDDVALLKAWRRFIEVADPDIITVRFNSSLMAGILLEMASIWSRNLQTSRLPFM